MRVSEVGSSHTGWAHGVCSHALQTPGCWELRRPVGAAEEEAGEEVGGQPGFSSESGEKAGDTSCGRRGMRLLELFHIQTITE